MHQRAPMDQSSCLRKRKRGGTEQLQKPSHVVGLQEVPHPEWIDLGCPLPPGPLPPGWEQCLDLQSGETYFVNSATQTRILSYPLSNMAAVQGKNESGGSGLTLGFDLGMKLRSSTPASDGMPELPFGGKVIKDACCQQQRHDGICFDSSLTPSSAVASPVTTASMDLGMAATVCAHCHTFVMVSRDSPHCPSCKNVCKLDFLCGAVMQRSY